MSTTTLLRSLGDLLPMHPAQWSEEERAAHGRPLNKLKPSAVGWLDDGQFYESLCDDEDFLETFVDDEAITSAPIELHSIPTLMYPCQEALDQASLDYYLSGGTPFDGPTSGYDEFTDDITMNITIKVICGIAFVFQGHHRLTALRLQGASHFIGRLIHVS